VRARPENRLALRELAIVLSVETFRPTQETLREAIECWRTLVRLDRNDRDAHYDLARAHRLFESWASAADEYREVLRIGQQPGDGDVWVYGVHGDLAEMLEKQGKLREAVAEWRALADAPAAGDEEIRRARERIAELERRL
jgi:tetratricopeptide (TPR) repeat protein